MLRQMLVSATLCLAAAGVFGQTNQIALNYNFNGLCHTGEFTGAANPGVADDLNGFRSISDRALYITGNSGSFALAPVVGATGLTYYIVRTPFVNDLVMLGNRNALWPFDLTLDGDNRGLQPTWLQNPDLSGPQTTNIVPPIILNASSQIGVLFQISDGGGRFRVLLRFSDGSIASAVLAGPDWFGSSNPVPPPSVVMQSQTSLGTFLSAGNFDNPQPSGPLNVIESVIGVANFLNAGLGDLRNKRLTSITFQDRFDPNGNVIAQGTGNRSFAILAVTVTGTVAPTNDDCSSATAITEGTFSGSTNGAVGLAGPSCGSADSADVWFRYTASQTGTTRVRLCGSGFDTTVAVFAGTCGGLGDPVACNNDLCGTASLVDFPVTRGSQYLIRVAGNNGASGSFNMTVYPPRAFAGPFVNPGNGHTYYLFGVSSWIEAEADASLVGGHLVTINDAEENAWVLNNVLNFDGSPGFRSGWVGLQRDINGAFAAWADGSPVGFTNWGPGEPNNFGGAEPFAQMVQPSGLWNDIAADSGSNGIIEIPTIPFNPLGVATATPASIIQGESCVVTVRVTPAGSPTSTGIQVFVGEFPGGTATIPALDDGINPDAIAGDNIFTVRLTPNPSQPAGAHTLPVTITDAQGRSSTAPAGLTIRNAIGACCQAAACQVLSRNACIAQGGNFLGHATACTDGYDITASTRAFEDISATGTPLDLFDESSANIPIGFNFTFYGNTYSSCFVFSNGFISFVPGSLSFTFTNNDPPTTDEPNNAIYGFWDNLSPGFVGSVAYELRGTAGIDKRLIVQWTGVPRFRMDDSNTFQMVLHENGSADFVYANIFTPSEGEVTIGTENSTGTLGDSYDGTQIGSGAALHLAVRTQSNPCAPPCAADFNHDGEVNADDLADYINCFFAQPPCPEAEFNGDGGVNADDLGDFINEFFGGAC